MTLGDLRFSICYFRLGFTIFFFAVILEDAIIAVSSLASFSRFSISFGLTISASTNSSSQ